MNNFYLKDGYHQDVKIIEITEKLPIQKIIYLDKNVTKILLEAAQIDFTVFFNNEQIKTIEIYRDKFVITREKNSDWNLILAIFFSTIDQFFRNKEFLKTLAIVEKKLSNYQEYQMSNIDYKIMIQAVYYAVYKRVGETMKQHNGGFEILELSISDKKIHLRLTGSCSGCSEYKNELKSVIITEIEKILLNYSVYFYN